MTMRIGPWVALVLLSACVTPPKMTGWVSDLNFKPLILPTRDDWRGHTLLRNSQVPDQTTCFLGDSKDPLPIGQLNHKYSKADLKRLAADWGGLFTAKGEFSSDSVLTVRLGDAVEQYWTDVEPTFDAACLDEDDSFAPKLDVIISVLRAQDIFVSYTSTDIRVSTLTMQPAIFGAGHPAVPTSIEGGRSLNAGADELLIASSAVLGYKTVRWNKTMKSWPVILEFSGQPVYVAGYSFLLKDISVNAGNSPAAHIDVANPEARVSVRNILLTPGSREVLKPGARRVDYIVVEKMDAKKVQLVLRRTLYSPKA
jgi:hypothetical protein